MIELTWEIPERVDDLEALLARVADCAVAQEGIAKGAMSIRIVSPEVIREINRETRRIDSVTDVLSFPMGENGKYDTDPATGAKVLGDIVISMEKAVEQAEMYGHGFQREVAYLTAHSMLHLLGYDHIEPLERVRMREKEEMVMNMLGLPASSSYVLDNEDN